MSDRFNIRVILLIFLRIILTIISAGTLGCHIAQHVLLSHDRTLTSTQNWWPEYKVYTLYYAGAGFSLLSSLLLVLSSCARQTVRGDRFLSVINAAFLIAVVVYCTLKAGMAPWVGPDNENGGAQGFATYCSEFSEASTVVFQRCWLQNGTWLGMIILAALWILLALFVFIQRPSSIYPREDFTPVLTNAAFAMPDSHPQSPVNYTSSGSPMMAYAQNSPTTGTHTPPPGAAYDQPYHYHQQPGYTNYTNYYNTPSSPLYRPYTPDYSNGSPSYRHSSKTYANNDGYNQYRQNNNYEEKTAASVSPSPQQSVSQPPHSHEATEWK